MTLFIQLVFYPLTKVLTEFLPEFLQIIDFTIVIINLLLNLCLFPGYDHLQIFQLIDWRIDIEFGLHNRTSIMHYLSDHILDLAYSPVHFPRIVYCLVSDHFPHVRDVTFHYFQLLFFVFQFSF